MAKAAAIVITGIAIALLVIYGADVAAGTDNPDKEGFLAMDHKARGYGLGGPAMVRSAAKNSKDPTDQLQIVHQETRPSPRDERARALNTQRLHAKSLIPRQAPTQAGKVIQTTVSHTQLGPDECLWGGEPLIFCV
jgi:hypothetical protein